MTQAFELVRNQWIKAQLQAPAPVQERIIPRLHEAKEIARLLGKPWLPVYQLQGQGKGGPLTAAYAGLDFAKPFFKKLLFVEEPTDEKVGRIPFWQPEKLTNLTSSDLVIVEAARHLVQKLPRQEAFILPHFVRHILDVQGNWQDVENRFHKTVHKNELRLVRKYGYTYDLSHDRADFDAFYDEMYLPTVLGRHGQMAMPLSMHEAYQYFRHGWLIRVKREADWVSGAVCYLQQSTVMFLIVGVKNSDPQLIQEGAISALYYATAHWANQRGHRAVNWLGTEPYLRHGAFQHKRKWGGAIQIPPHLHRLVWIGIRNCTPAVFQFLRENPCIVVDDDRKLHGLVIVDDPQSVSDETKRQWARSYATPGLTSLRIRSISRCAEDRANVIRPDLTIHVQIEASK